MTPAMASGAVLGRGAFSQHFDVIDGSQGNEIQIYAGTAGVGRSAVDRKTGSGVAALAVNQHEHVVGGQSAQSRLQRLIRHVGTERLGLKRRDELRQGVDQCGLTGRLQCFTIDDLDGSRTLGRDDAGLARTGNDDLLQGVLFDGRAASRGNGLRPG